MMVYNKRKYWEANYYVQHHTELNRDCKNQCREGKPHEGTGKQMD